jgi:uncharacterized protein (AIM24 family)
MESNLTVSEQVEGENTTVQILHHNSLDGCEDIETAKTLYYAKQVGMHLKQVRIILNGGEAILESRVLHFMKGNISLEAKSGGLGGLAKKIASSALTGETTFRPHYKGVGEIYLEPTFGHFILAKLDGEEIIVDKGMFYASEGSVEVGVAGQKNLSSALFGGEGFFQTKLTGRGWCVLVSPVPSSEIIRFQLNNEKLSVDGNFALLRKGHIDFKVEKSTKSVIGSMRSGEGLLQTFTGTGEVWLAPTQSVYEQLSQRGFRDLTQSQGSSGQTTN